MKNTTYPHSVGAKLAAEAADRASIFESLEARRHLHAGHDGVFINAGATAPFVDSGGHSWSTDANFTGGEGKSTVYDVANSPDDALYATRRFGASFAYAIPLASAGNYRVTLHFAEPWFTQNGQRVFDVSAEGTRRLAAFDVFAVGGAKSTVTRAFDVNVADNTLNLQFTGIVENAIVSGISVERAALIPATPTGLVATAVSATQIDLRWTDTSSDETGFAIERSTDGGATFTRIAFVNGNVTTFSNTALVSGTTYAYRVRATSAAGMSTASNLSSARTLTSGGTGSQTPFSGTPIRIPGTVQAENFDNGGSNIAFLDATPGNAGGVYRDTPVDVYTIPPTAVMPTGSTTLSNASSTPAAQYSVGSLRAGEWLEYTVDVASTASFGVSFVFASGSEGGKAAMTLNGQPVWGGEINLPNTGGWSRFSLINLPVRSIVAGRHVVRVTFTTATRPGTEIGVLDSIRFSSVTIGMPPTTVAAPGGLVVRAVGDTQVNLAWSDVANETGYRVQRRDAIGSAWTSLADLPAGRNWFVDGAVTHSTSYVYRVTSLGAAGAVGGSSEKSVTTILAENFKWKGSTSNPLARYEAGGAAVNGRLYVFGGYINSNIQATARVDSFDPARGTWRQLRDMPEVATHVGQVVDGDFIYIAGGFLGDHPGLGSTSVWRYDTTRDTYERMPSLPAPRGAGAMSIVARELHFFGGLDRAQFATINQSEHWVLDLTNPALGWKKRAALPNARNHLSAVTVGDKIYAIGGQDLWNELSGAMSNVDVFDYRTNTWSAAAPLPIPRSHVSASTFAVDGKIWVIGGATNGFKTMRDVTVYDPATNAWSARPQLLAPRLTPVAGVIGKLLVVSAGSAFGLQPQSETFVGLLD